MTVQQLPEYLKRHWPVIREQLLSGTYKPQPVKRVEIPKPDGGMPKLGIPTLPDRFIQQAVMQVLQARAVSGREFPFQTAARICLRNG
jgi:RNA-directed DNA polymerase